MRRLLGLLVVGIGFFVLAGAGADFTRFYPYEEARALAREHRRVLMIYFRSIYCPYCEQVETFVLGDPEVIRALASCFVVGMVTLERPEGPALFRAHRVAGTPAFVWLKPEDGEFRELGRAFGNLPKTEFLSLVSRYCTQREDEDKDG